MTHAYESNRMSGPGLWRSFKGCPRQPYNPPREPQKLMAHHTQTPPWVLKKKRRAKDKIAKESRRRNRG